jgi:RNA polymerase sigma-70 factor (ECF subfamily)
MVASAFPPVLPPPPALNDRAGPETPAQREARHDAALVQRFNSGNETAFIEIVERYREKLYTIAFGLLRNHADAEEIAQDALIRAHRGLVRFRGDASLATWLHRITLNLARNRYWYHFRRCRHSTLPLDAALSDDNHGSFAGLLASGAPSPVREMANNELAAIIVGCTELLTADQQEILHLRNVQHHSYLHISKRLGVGLGTVKSRIARARSRLRTVLAQSYPEFTRADPWRDGLEASQSTGSLMVAGS